MEVVTLAAARSEDIIRILQSNKYRNRIGIFHYAGHANGKGLQLEGSDSTVSSEFAYSQGIARLLREQENLKLIFLNGCDTERHVVALSRQRITSSIIVTSQNIDDKIAMSFASSFYDRFTSGETIDQAFRSAECAMEMTIGDDPRKAYAEGCFVESTEPPWHIHGSNESGAFSFEPQITPPPAPPINQNILFRSWQHGLGRVLLIDSAGRHEIIGAAFCIRDGYNLATSSVVASDISNAFSKNRVTAGVAWEENITYKSDVLSLRSKEDLAWLRVSSTYAPLNSCRLTNGERPLAVACWDDEKKSWQKVRCICLNDNSSFDLSLIDMVGTPLPGAPVFGERGICGCITNNENGRIQWSSLENFQNAFPELGIQTQ